MKRHGHPIANTDIAAEILEDLQAALAKFAEIATDLRKTAKEYKVRDRGVRFADTRGPIRRLRTSSLRSPIED